MLGIESDLLDALRSDPSVTALVGDRIYAGEPPDHLSPSPWIYFSIPSERPGEELAANDAVVWELDFELFAKRYQDARTLKRAVRAALNRYRGGHVRRCLWTDSDSSAVEGGHNITERYTVWGTDPTVIPQPGGNARILTSAGAVHFYPTGGPSPVVTIDALGRILGDGSELTNLPQPDLSGYATMAAVAAGYQPLDSDLTEIAALPTTTFGRGILTATGAQSAREMIGMGNGDSPSFNGLTLSGQASGRLLLTSIGGMVTSNAGLMFDALTGLALGDAGIVRDSLNTLRVTNASGGVGNLITRNLTVRQPGGTAGTNEVRLLQDGNGGVVQATTGRMRLFASEGNGWFINLGGGVNRVQIGDAGTVNIEINNQTLRFRQNHGIQWVSTNVDPFLGTADIGMVRHGTNTARITDGSTGHGDLRLRNLTMTGATITTPNSFAWGTNVDVNGGLQGVVIGHGTTPTATRGGGTGAVAIGRDCVTTGGVAIGNVAWTGGSSSIAIGRSVDAAQSTSVAVGFNATVGSSTSIAIGSSLTTAGTCSAAIGSDIPSTIAGEFAWGVRDQNPSFSANRFAGTPTTRKVFSIDGSWVAGGSVVDATRTGRMTLGVFNATTLQEGVRIDANSGGVRLGFYGVTAVARPTLPDSGTVTADHIRTALISLGLCQ